MQVWINGESRLLNLETTIHQLLAVSRRVAVELNEKIAPRSQHDTCQVCEGDHYKDTSMVLAEIFHTIKPSSLPVRAGSTQS